MDVAVDSELYEIAGKIRTIVDRVSPAQGLLNVVITCDHGRLLGRSQRAIQPPASLKPHERGAWGAFAVNIQFSESSKEEDEIVWLNPFAYGLPTSSAYVVALSDRSFVMADGKSGVEWFPHGGLFPEEVIVPWVTLALNVKIPPLVIAVSGSGAVGQLGHVELRLTNPNSYAINVKELVLTIEGEAQSPWILGINQTAPAINALDHQCPLAPWPDVRPETKT